MREIDRLAIARELLGSVVDDRVSFTEPAEIIANTPTADVAVPLPRPTKASRPKTPLAYMAQAQPVARPGQHAHVNSNEIVPAPKSKTAIRGEAPGEGAPATAEIAEVQRLLKRLGYQIGDIDGVFGKRTELAIRSFQQRRGTGVDGRISGTLIAQLRRAATRKVNARSQRRRDSLVTPCRGDRRMPAGSPRWSPAISASSGMTSTASPARGSYSRTAGGKRIPGCTMKPAVGSYIADK